MDISTLSDTEIKEEVYKLYLVYQELNEAVDALYKDTEKVSRVDIEKTCKKILDEKKTKKVEFSEDITIYDNLPEKVI